MIARRCAANLSSIGLLDNQVCGATPNGFDESTFGLQRMLADHTLRAAENCFTLLTTWTRRSFDPPAFAILIASLSPALTADCRPPWPIEGEHTKRSPS